MDYYSVTHPWGMDGWVGHVGWLIADGLTTNWSPVQLAVWRRIGNVRWPRPAFYHYVTPWLMQQLMQQTNWAGRANHQITAAAAAECNVSRPILWEHFLCIQDYWSVPVTQTEEPKVMGWMFRECVITGLLWPDRPEVLLLLQRWLSVSKHEMSNIALCRTHHGV